MKQVLIILCLSITTISLSQTQNTIENGFTIEPYIGFSTSTFILEDAPQSSFLKTEVYGINGNYYFNNSWSLKFGLINDKMGGSLFGLSVLTPDGNINFLSDVEQQSFITLPLQASWHFGKRKRWNVAFGLTYSISTGAEIEIGGQRNSSFTSSSYDIGYRVPVSGGFIQFNSSTLLRFKEDNSPFDSQMRNMLTIGYLYNLQ